MTQGRRSELKSEITYSKSRVLNCFDTVLSLTYSIHTIHDTFILPAESLCYFLRFSSLPPLVLDLFARYEAELLLDIQASTLLLLFFTLYSTEENPHWSTCSALWIVHRQ